MKKIILGMLIILTSLSFSNNLDKYQSKRVFDKNIEVLLTGNYDKYKDDPEMVRALGEIDKKSETKMSEEVLLSYKNNQYKVTDVKENKYKSELTVLVTYCSFLDVLQDEPLEELQIEIFNKFQEVVDESGKTEEELEDEYVKVLLNVLYEKYKEKAQKKTKIIKVHMNKKNGLWDIIGFEEETNNELFYTFFPILEISEIFGDTLAEQNNVVKQD